MSNKYDDYGYEDNYNNGSNVKRIFIAILVVVAIVLVIFLLKGCLNTGGKKPTPDPVGFDYENTLLNAGKKFYENNSDLYPVAIGECGQVELQTLIDKGLVNPTEFATCNASTTYVRVCVLEDGRKQFTPWLTCTDKNSDSEYADFVEGTINDIVTDKSLIKFTFLPQGLKAAGQNLGKVEEIWKDEIKYASYKTLATNKYYRYKDKLYIWNIEIKKYYTSKGEQSSSKNVKEYYVTQPNSNYPKKDNKATAYKWFTTTSEKVYALGPNGSKDSSAYPIDGYPYNDGGVEVTRYRTRTVTGTYDPTLYYQCAVSKGSTFAKNQKVPCGQGSDPELVYEVKRFYACVDGSSTSVLDNIVAAGTKCKKYSAWGKETPKACTPSDTCQKLTAIFYHWYKLEESAEKTYYPSGLTDVTKEKVYYTEAPIKGAQKDVSTKATAYKWYNSTDGQTSEYLAVAPDDQPNATKTDQSKWSDWSSWRKTKPTATDGRTRTIESKTKIKLQEIKGTTEEGWEDLSTTYVTEDEMITIFNNKGYKVNTLGDITNNGEIRYKVKMLIRNKKEAN